MSTITVQGVKNAGDLTQYLFHGHNSKDSRAAAFALSMSGPFASVESFVAKAKEIARVNGRSNQLYSYVLAFHPDEFDVEAQRDLETVRDIACELAERMHDADYMVVVHDDADGGHVHAHIAVMNEDRSTGRALRDYTSWRHGLHQLNDRVMSEFGLNVLPDPSRQLGSWSARRNDFTPGGIEQQLGDKIVKALNDPRSVDFDSYKQVLADDGVTLAKTVRDGLTYKMREKSSNKLRRRKASRLCPDFVWDRVVKQFEINKKREDPFTEIRAKETARRDRKLDALMAESSANWQYFLDHGTAKPEPPKPAQTTHDDVAVDEGVYEPKKTVKTRSKHSERSRSESRASSEPSAVKSSTTPRNDVPLAVRRDPLDSVSIEDLERELKRRKRLADLDRRIRETEASVPRNEDDFEYGF